MVGSRLVDFRNGAVEFAIWTLQLDWVRTRSLRWSLELTGEHRYAPHDFKLEL